eukprot:CAMPEP_0113855396 /NCGR_PEP_ID=MMETSP0372-20130328/8203_1 /TAXON_ID=340204 /ORGANISM="Lankesteria abbotti" /LENGTH=176 /DNA_ID=CAMNT_0000829373 /DNA_START=549 /DNA_END=1079 /DNA_ORIENTATION=+ /assembly_acc=CAM_ASM_000359
MGVVQPILIADSRVTIKIVMFDIHVIFVNVTFYIFVNVTFYIFVNVTFYIFVNVTHFNRVTFDIPTTLWRHTLTGDSPRGCSLFTILPPTRQCVTFYIFVNVTFYIFVNVTFDFDVTSGHFNRVTFDIPTTLWRHTPTGDSPRGCSLFTILPPTRQCVMVVMRQQSSKQEDTQPMK